MSQCEDVAGLLKQLAHPQRLKILCHLVDRERTVSDLEEVCQASQSQISQFLTRMKIEGLVESRREGKFVFYNISNPAVVSIIKALHKTFCC